MTDWYLVYICAMEGHVILWTSSTTDDCNPPEGEYVCQRCFCEVAV